MKAAIYIRVSTKKQKVDLQKEKLVKYAKNKEYDFKIYEDQGYSGKSEDRPSFKRLMRDAEKKLFDTVIVTKLDRFGRSVQDLINSVKLLESYDIIFEAIDNNIITSTPQGRLMFNLLATIAEFERELIVERMEEGRERARQQGKVCHRPEIDLPKEDILKWKEMGLSDAAVAKLCNVTRTTIWKRLKTWGYK